MVGICGSFGHDVADSTQSAIPLSFKYNHTHHYTSNFLDVSLITHKKKSQPAETTKGALIWVWGNVYGYESDKYNPKNEAHAELSVAEYCAKLYEKDGLSFVEGLNSEFIVIIFEPDRGTLHFATDRTSSRPLYLYETKETTLFATNLQVLINHPIVDPELDQDSIKLYCAIKYVPGRSTAIKKVTQLPPASIFSVDVKSKTNSKIQHYWRPAYEPIDKPKSYFVDKLINILSKSVAERLPETSKTGLMLSGGTDSRLLSTICEQNLICYHINDWKNTEYKIASSVAAKTGNEFQFLERDSNYHRRVLEKNAHSHEFISEFQQAHAGGFRERLSEEVEIIMHGMFGDTFFDGNFLPQKNIATPLGTVVLPQLAEITSISDFIDSMDMAETSYLQSNTLPRSILNDRLHHSDGELVYGGVTYPDMPTFLYTSNWYPLTNQPDYLFYSNLLQFNDIHSPFLDNRLIDLHLSIPLEHQLKGRLVSTAVNKTNSELSEMSHPSTKVAIKRGYLMQLIGENIQKFVIKYFGEDFEQPYYTDRAWQNQAELIRHTGWVGEKLEEHDKNIKSEDIFDGAQIESLYKEHMNGENNYKQLYRLLTILEMPIIDRVVNSR